jgi:hypothetical protein
MVAIKSGSIMRSDIVLPSTEQLRENISLVHSRSKSLEGFDIEKAAPVFQLAPRFILPQPTVSNDGAIVNKWLEAHGVHAGDGTPAQRDAAIQKLWSNRPSIESRSGHDFYLINDVLDQFPRVLSGINPGHSPSISREFQKLDTELGENFRSLRLHGPYRVEFDLSTQKVKIVPVQSRLSDAEVARADGLIENFQNFTRLKERYSPNSEIKNLMVRLGRNMIDLQRNETDFYLKLKDYVSPAAEGGMFASLSPEDRIKFVVFMEQPSSYAIPTRHYSVLAKPIPLKLKLRELNKDILAIDKITEFYRDPSVLPGLLTSILNRLES